MVLGTSHARESTYASKNVCHWLQQSFVQVMFCCDSVFVWLVVFVVGFAVCFAHILFSSIPFTELQVCPFTQL